jgi:hypothetical protein
MWIWISWILIVHFIGCWIFCARLTAASGSFSTWWDLHSFEQKKWQYFALRSFFWEAYVGIFVFMAIAGRCYDNCYFVRKILDSFCA